MNKNPYLVLKNISKSFGNFEAVKNVNLEINKSEFFGLLGSSGCGKSTLLTNDNSNLNYMFQSYEFFQHINVFKNI